MISDSNIDHNNSNLISNSNMGKNDEESLISNSTSGIPNRTSLNSEDQKKIDDFIEKKTKVDEKDLINFEEVSIRRTLFFRLYVTGTIEYGNFVNFGDSMGTSPIKVKSSFVFGKDWDKEDGNISEESQFSFKGDGTYNYYSFNNQFEISFRSINLYGWPQIVVTCSTINSSGTEVVLGYGCVHVPMSTGRHERKIHIFSLNNEKSIWEKWFGKKNERSSEIIKNPKVISTGQGREISRAKCEGWIKLIFQINFRDFNKFGFISK